MTRLQLLVVCLLIAGCRCGWAAADPWEVDPLQETPVVTAAWGAGEAEFAPPSNWGQGEQVRGAGPFCLDAGGHIYIADPPRTRVLVFDAGGRWMKTIHLPKGKNLIDDMAVSSDGRLYWFGETVWGYGIYGIDLATEQSQQLLAPADATFKTTPEGTPLTDAAQLIVAPDGVRFFNRLTGVSYRLSEGTKPLSREDQLASKMMGMPVENGPRLLGVFRGFRSNARTTAGERVGDGDMVTLTPTGAIDRILIERGGLPLGSDAEGRLLVADLRTVGKEAVGYLAVHAPDGTLLSRTRMGSPRPLEGRVLSGPRYRMHRDSSIFELYLTEQAVHVSRWARGGGSHEK